MITQKSYSRTFIVFSLILFSFMNTPMASQAQTAVERDDVRAEQMLADISKTVTLDTKQKTTIKQILVNNQAEFRAEREAAKGDKLSIFRLANERLKKIDEQIESILRSDQKEGYEAAKESLRQRMREKRN